MQKQFHTKNQHYVPQFYLRNFSEDGKVFQLLNLSSGRVIPRAKISCQCSKDYFYGKDGLIETNLGAFEEECSKWFRECLSLNNPKNSIPDIVKCWLIRFAAVQSMRTKKNIESIIASNTKHNRIISSLYERDYGPGSVPIQYQEHDYSDLPGWSFITAIINCGVLTDLSCVLLDNETEEDFVASDNPVVFQNPLIEQFAVQYCSGFASSGLQIYYPISPRRMVCLYDSKAYKFSVRNHIHLTNLKDVEMLNNLQFMNAENNVYFKSSLADFSKYLHFRNQNINKQDESVITEEDPNGSGSVFIQSSKIMPRIAFKLSVFKIIPKMLHEAYSSNHYFLHARLRNATLCSWVQEFACCVQIGQCNWLEFGKFYMEKLKELHSNDFGVNHCHPQ